MQDIDVHPWRAPAAYLYTLALDPVCLAWEYLRRNLAYQAAWASHTSGRRVLDASEWGLKEWENPRRDARVAEPIWCPAPVSSVQVIPSFVGEATTTFQLWRIEGRKSLVHDGTGLHLTAKRHTGVTRAVLAAGVAADLPYAYQIPAGGHVDGRCRAVREFETQYSEPLSRRSRESSRPDRSALTHMRTLQSMDGASCGASHRDLAIAVFGFDTVIESWSPDGELRAQVRYLLKRGRALTGGGYRELLIPGPS